MGTRKLTLHETQLLIANKPLALVNLEHSDHNKKIVIKALGDLWADGLGSETFQILQEFLGNVAPNYQLNPSQEGVRKFLLREMSRIASQKMGSKKGLFNELAGKFRLAFN